MKNSIDGEYAINPTVQSRITHPTEGEMRLRERVGSLLEVGTGFHTELTGRENIYFNGAILGMKKRKIDEKFDEIVRFDVIEKFLDTPVKRHSSGMYVRLAFAVAAHIRTLPNIIRKKLQAGFFWSMGILDVGRTCKNLAPVIFTNFLQFKSHKPTICAVLASRNDNYVQDNEARIRAMIEWNSKVLCDEIIFVEWNPIPNTPLLSLALAKDYPNLKAYIVPKEIHETICTNPNMPVMEFFAKNVGIRRAQSDYICATNADIFWDLNVARMRWFLNKKLVFRTRRVELSWNGHPPNQHYLRNSVNRIEFRNGLGQGITYGCGDFTLAHKELWHRTKGYDEFFKKFKKQSFSLLISSFY